MSFKSWLGNISINFAAWVIKKMHAGAEPLAIKWIEFKIGLITQEQLQEYIIDEQ